MGHVSNDASGFLLPWYHTIKEGGQLRSLSSQVGNYNLLYQFCIALMTYLPFGPLTVYKVFSCVFDYLLALSVGLLVCQTVGEGRGWRFLASYSMVLLSPVVISNSATWAQCDSIYTFWLVLSLLFLIRRQYLLSLVFFGIAMAFKLQAVFFLPFLLFAYFRLRRFSILYFSIVPMVMWASGIPAYLAGRGMFDSFTIYQSQADTCERLSMNYPSFWLLLTSTSGDNAGYVYELYKPMAVMLTVCVLAAWMVCWTYRKTTMDGDNLLYMAFVLTYTVVLFLPSMHERYGYVYEILAIAVALRDRRTLPLLAALTGMTLMTYGGFLHGRPVNLYLCAVVNCCVYLAYSYMLGIKHLTKE